MFSLNNVFICLFFQMFLWFLPADLWPLSFRRLHLHKKRPEVKQPFMQLAGVSLLKPLKGVDPNLISNLETFFTLDYPKVKPNTSNPDNYPLVLPPANLSWLPDYQDSYCPTLQSQLPSHCPGLPSLSFHRLTFHCLSLPCNIY